jgi:hypothetical protein
MGEIHLECGDDSKAIKEAVSKLYESLRADVTEAFPNAEERFLAASAMWHVETANPNLEVPRKACKELSRQLLIEFNLEPEYERLHEAMPKDTYVLSVPFEEFELDGSGKTVRDKKRQPVGKDLAGHWKELLDSKGIKYEATLHPSLPMVNFALIEPSEKLVGILEKKFGENVNDIDSLDLTYRDGLGRTKDVSSHIVAPADYTWLESQNQTPKAALVLNLFTDEICQQLQTFQFDRAELIGQKYNDLKDVDFSSPKWRQKTLTFEVGSVSGSGSRRDGSPIILLDGQELAMFSTNSPKLPIGTTFEATIEPSPKGSALILNINPSSVRLIESVEELSEVAPTPCQDRSLSVSPTPCQERPLVSSTPTQKRSQSVSPTPTQNKPPSQPEDLAASPAHLSELLKDAISEAYNQTGETKIPVGNWTAFISKSRNNVRCLVRDEADNPVLAADLKTGQIIKKLSENNSSQFIKYLREVNAELASTSSKKRDADTQL